MGVISLDRFSVGPNDPQEVPIYTDCHQCGGEIYCGEEMMVIDGNEIHEDCLLEFAKEYFKDCKEVAAE